MKQCHYRVFAFVLFAIFIGMSGHTALAGHLAAIQSNGIATATVNEAINEILPQLQ